MAVAAKPEVEIWRRPKNSILWPWFPIHSFRHFLAKTHRFATIQNVTDRQTTDDRRHTVPKARPIVRSAKNSSYDLGPDWRYSEKAVLWQHGFWTVIRITTLTHPLGSISIIFHDSLWLSVVVFQIQKHERTCKPSKIHGGRLSIVCRIWIPDTMVDYCSCSVNISTDDAIVTTRVTRLFLTFLLHCAEL